MSNPAALANAAGVVLLRDDGAALLQHRDDKPGLSARDQWVFPGGGSHPGESGHDCALRECHEETGYLCAALNFVTEFAFTCTDTGRGFWLSFWSCRYDGIQPVRCYEGQEVRFVPRDEATRLHIPEYLTAVWDIAFAGEKRTLRPGASHVVSALPHPQ